MDITGTLRMDKIVDFVLKNWVILKAAPLVHISFHLITLPVVLFIINFIYKERIETLKEQITTLKERLVSKDDQVNEYRQRLHIIEKISTTYSLLSNKELKSKSLEVAEKLMHFRENKESEH